MTSIHGVDPIIVNNIKVKTQKSVVIETHKSKVSHNQSDKKDQGQDKQHHPQPALQDLVVAVEKLNKLLERNQIKLFFQIVSEPGWVRVQLMEMESGKIISEILPEKVLDLLDKFSTTGFTINELI